MAVAYVWGRCTPPSATHRRLDRGSALRDRKYSRRDILKASTALGAVFAEPARAAAPASTAVNSVLIEAARKEGKIALYSALDLTLSEKLARAFEATYPGIPYGSSV